LGGAAADGLASMARVPLPVLILVFCVVFPLNFNVGPLLVTSLRLFLMVMIVPLAIKLLLGRYGRIIATDILFFFYVLWSAVALAVNNPSSVVQQTGSTGVEFLGGYLVARAYIRTPAAFIGLCRLLVGVVLLMLPFAIVEALTTRSVLLEVLGSIPGVGTVAVVFTESRLGLDRVQATLEHPIHYGLFCSVVLSLCLVGLKGTMGTGRRLVSGVLIFGAGFLALSSAAISALALQLGLILWSLAFARLRWRWWLLLGLFILAYIVIDVLSNRTPIRVFLHYMTFSAHTGYWRLLILEYGLQNVAANPIFGIGLNDWVRPAWMFTQSVDNFWLLSAMSFGIPGFIFLAGGYLLVLGRVMWRDFEGDRVLSQLRLAWVFTFLGLSFVLITVHVWGSMYSFVFFIFGSGVWFLQASPQQMGEKEHTTLPRQLSESAMSRTPVAKTDKAMPAPDEGRRSPYTRF